MINRFNIPATKEWVLPRYLKGHILAAVPDMLDNTFREALIFMIDHNEEGAFGCVFNHLSASRLGDVIDAKDPLIASTPLYIGGPVQQNLLFAIHNGVDNQEISENAVGPVNGLYFEPEIEPLVEYLSQKRPVAREIQYRFFAGYSGWDPLQLEGELDRSTWITLPYDSSLLFANDHNYETALRKKGGMYWIAAETGMLPSKN
ncbi:MAG: YqgE/AlgH family protein [Spirochaetales bacterium]|nr:YqgE/AlgH family protein [Spirochaetales bacterium]